MSANRLTPVGHAAPRSHHFITVGHGQGVTEDKNQTRRSQRQETAENRRSSTGCTSTRNLRRCFVTCGFLLSGYNDLGSKSCNSRNPTILSAVSGSGNESAHSAKSMSNHKRTNSHNHKTDASTANYHTPATDQQTAPPECPACDGRDITVEHGRWHCAFCTASGVLGGDRA